MSDLALIPLAEVFVTCCDCGSKDNAADINADKIRYHKSADGRAILFPKNGVTPTHLKELQKLHLRCECCQEDLEENLD